MRGEGGSGNRTGALTDYLEGALASGQGVPKIPTKAQQSSNVCLDALIWTCLTQRARKLQVER